MELPVIEIFNSISGEVCSFGQGRRCTFIRVSECNLACFYCDTRGSQKHESGKTTSIENIMKKVEQLRCKYIIITGGEPLIHPNLHALVSELLDRRYQVVIETNGTVDINTFPPDHFLGAKWVVDYKLQYQDQMKFPHALLGEKDFIKFVIWEGVQISQAIRTQKRIQKDNPRSRVNFAYSILKDDLNFTVSPTNLLQMFRINNIDAFINFQIHKPLNLG